MISVNDKSLIEGVTCKGGSGCKNRDGTPNKYRHKPTTLDLDRLEIVIDLIARRGFPPTIRELCDAFGISSTNAVVGWIHRMCTCGLVGIHHSKISRTLKVHVDKMWLDAFRKTHRMRLSR